MNELLLLLSININKTAVDENKIVRNAKASLTIEEIFLPKTTGRVLYPVERSAEISLKYPLNTKLAYPKNTAQSENINFDDRKVSSETDRKEIKNKIPTIHEL